MNNTADFIIENGMLKKYIGSDTDVIIPNGVTEINFGAFCKEFLPISDVTSVTIPGSVTTILGGAFYGCTCLTNIIVDPSNSCYSSDSLGVLYSKDKTKLIQYPAGNKSLSYTIPNIVKSIDRSAFLGCSNLAEIIVDPSNSFYSSDSFGVLFNKDKTELIQYPAGNKSTNYAMPCSVTSVANNAFSCSNLANIVMSDSITSINNEMFRGCKSLVGVIIPSGVTSIGERAFEECTSLTTIIISNSVTRILNHAFFGCSSLTNIVIPNSVTGIGESAFYGCTSLASITLSNSITDIGTAAFRRCTSLTNIIIPGNITVISNSAFSQCTNLTNVTLPDSITSIGPGAFSDCTNLKSITIPNGVTTIGEFAFYDCKSLASITIPTGVTAIDKNVFYGCTSLANVTIPDSVTSIGKEAFSGCSSLTNIVIPNSVTGIGERAFYGCTSLAGVTIPDSVTSIGFDAFSLVDKVIYNPNIIAPEYSKWGAKTLVKSKSLSASPDDFEIADGTLIKLSGLADCATIPDSVTSIGEWAFSDCANLTTIIIGSSVMNIDDTALFGCEKLESIFVDQNNNYYSSDSHGVLFNKDKTKLIQYPVENKNQDYTIPDSVTVIGDRAFLGCENLTNIIIGNNVTSIGIENFFNCQKLETISVNQNNRYYSSDGFGVLFNKDKTLLIRYPVGNKNTGYSIPDSVTSIGDFAFQSCESLSNIAIPDSITSIGPGAFSDCTSLTNIIIPDSVTSIGALAFSRCTSLTNIIIPDSVTSIGEDVFEGCSSLTNITMSIEKIKNGSDALPDDKGSRDKEEISAEVTKEEAPAASADFKFCRKCGSKLPGDSMSCDKCGAEIDY